MAVTVKKKVVEKSVQSIAQTPLMQVEDQIAAIDLVAQEQDTFDELGQEIDLLGALEEDAKLATDFLKDYNARKKVIQDKLVAMEASQHLGAKYYAELGDPSTVREIKDMALVRKVMGDETFMAVAKVQLKDVDQYLTEAEKAEVLDVSKTGARKLTIKKRV